MVILSCRSLWKLLCYRDRKGDFKMKKILSVFLTVLLVFCIIQPTVLSAYSTNCERIDSNLEGELTVAYMLPELTIDEDTLQKSSDALVRENSKFIVDEAAKISSMNIDELNNYIDSAIIVQESNEPFGNSGSTQSIVDTVTLKALWLAAAQIAKLAGYPCAAKLIEYSVLGINYNEKYVSNGLFAKKIKTTKTYTNFLSAIKKGTKSTGKYYVLTHSKSENKDLYYSIHSCSYCATKSNGKYKIHVYDKYDFEISGYDSLFTGLVNNWAWLCQHKGVLHVIYVNIYFNA